MKLISEKPIISLREAKEHYESSRENYKNDSAESHLPYYREKYPLYYQVLLNNV
ncbi:hypothetical protein [Maribacter litoralis]|uniref:hypothetical protein n=1 Tax=Maribacter litoralis TaxID=2059726 RepID=UPI003F5CC2DB|tara:strand:+ start:369 stop:530 length:162 start_codon:yes stop_codon:yes gene_type:complete